MKSYRIILFIFLMCPALSAHSQDSIREKKWSIDGYLKDMQNVIFYKIDDEWLTGNLIHNRLNLKWNISPSFTTAISARNRFFYGNMMTMIPGYEESFKFDDGLISMSWNIFTGKSYALNTTIDRLWIDCTYKNFQVTLGRQRINWGLNFVWNPNDIFNAYSYLDFDYEEKPGSDAARVQYYPSSTSRIELSVKASKDTKITAAAFYQFNKRSYDFQFMTGIFEADYFVAGAGWAGQIAKGGFRGEMSYFTLFKNIFDTCGTFVASVGYDYTFTNSLFLQFEALYNGNPSGTLGTLTNLDYNPENAMSAMNPYLSGFSLFGGISYPFNPLFSGSLSGIYTWGDDVGIFIPSLNYSVSDNIDLMMLAQILELFSSTDPVRNANFFFLRLKWSF